MKMFRLVLTRCFLLVGLAVALTVPLRAQATDGWVSLFDGKTLHGWKGSEHPDSVHVVDGMIMCDGPRSHLMERRTGRVD